MADSPRVSVCVAAFNAERFIAQAIESVLAQSFTDFELLIVDDGSSDATAVIADGYARTDGRIRVLRNHTNRGLIFTRNRSLNESRGGLVAIADADDISEPDRLAIQVAHLDLHPGLGAVGSDVTLIDEHGARLGVHSQRHRASPDIRFFLLFGPCIHNPTTIYRRTLLERVGGYSEGYDAGAEDYHLWGKLAAITDMTNLPQPLVRYRKHSASVTADRRGVDANIFSISAALLSSYLESEVRSDQARLLHQWVIKQGMNSAECGEAFKLARKIWEVASEQEGEGTLGRLADLFSDAAWAHANYVVYADRRLSLSLARFARKARGSTTGEGVLVYAGRLVSPNSLRLLFKRKLESP